ncbi:hypothetical protein WMY93_026858 [Mugilogobius chulae]|uniref:PAW domain-containing protein n=1 Tax=Mugilogobius chulae TaxID=88201 RepID=A0AAW0MYK4_9GOBI
MVYLSRTPGNSSGSVKWKFDVGPEKIQYVTIMAKSETFHSGKVRWTIVAGSSTHEFSGNGKTQNFPQLSGSTGFTIVAELSGGNVDRDWQHSQLFRQSFTDLSQTSFEVMVQLENFEGFVFTPTDKERRDRQMHVRYTTSTDKYCRLSDNNNVTDGWKSCMQQAVTVMKHEEHDWRMVYLCRERNADKGFVKWKFNTAPATIQSVDVMAKSETFHNGRVSWKIQSRGNNNEFAGDGKKHNFPVVAGATDFVIAAEVSGGVWEHAQLFRQGFDDRSETFEVIVKF